MLPVGGVSHVSAQVVVSPKLGMPTAKPHPLTSLAMAGLALQQASLASLAPLHNRALVGSEAFLVHPAAADAALHLGAVAKRIGEQTHVPTGVQALAICPHNADDCQQGFGWAATGQRLLQTRPLCQQSN